MRGENIFMRILMVNTVSTSKNGITNVIFNLIRSIDKNQITIDLLAIEKPDQLYINEIEKYGGKVIILHRNIKHIARYVKKLSDVIKIGNYEIVHVHGNSHTIALDLFAAKIAKCKNRIAHSHSTTCSSILMHKVLSPFFNFCCTHRLACGIDAGRWMFGKKNFEVINNGVDTSKYIFDRCNREEIRNLYKLENKVVIGHVGGFYETKNQSFLIDVLNHMDKEMSCLMLVGDGPLKNKVHNKAVTLGLENNVIFIGETDYVEKYLSAMDCIVMPSLFEGLPLALIEQQTNGLCCIVSDNITEEVNITGNVSFVSLSAPISAWIDKIECTVRKEIVDNSCRQTKSIMAVKCVKKKGYDIYEEAKKLKSIYMRLAGRRAEE